MSDLKLIVVPALVFPCWLAPHPVCGQTGAATGERPATVQTRTDLTVGYGIAHAIDPGPPSPGGGRRCPAATAGRRRRTGR